VVSAAVPTAVNVGFVHRSQYFLLQVAPHLSRVNLVPGSYLENHVSLGELGTSGSATTRPQRRAAMQLYESKEVLWSSNVLITKTKVDERTRGRTHVTS
jgi:hypothetical protein